MSLIHTQHASRVKNIYIPKINFLKKVLKKKFYIRSCVEQDILLKLRKIEN